MRAKFGNSTVSGGAVFLWGAIFNFSQKIGLKSIKKRAILHTSQANGGGLEPPPRPPPGYATGVQAYPWFVQLAACMLLRR